MKQLPRIVLATSIAVLGGLLSPGLVAAEDKRPVVPACVMTEISFKAADTHADPFNSVVLDVVFTTPSGRSLRVPAFWAGDATWKVRYSSPEVGRHRFLTDCSAPEDAGLHGVAGAVEVVPYEGENRLYKHGPLRVSPDKRFLQHADGTPFFWLGDTWWMGLCHRLQWPGEVQRLAADRKEKGFNVIQIVAGLYPDMHPFDPRGANEAGHPWEADFAAIRPAYFDAADARLTYLVDQGFTPCIVGAWGYFMPWMGVDKVKQHWRFLIARYGALPVVWCAAGEANLPWYLAKGFPYDDREQVTQWTEVLRYIRSTDPYGRPLTIHPTGIGRLSSRHATDDASLIDFDLLQTPHAGREAVDVTIRTVRESLADEPRMPVIDGEAAYEMLGDSLPTKWSRQMFWLCMTHGAAGHTYGANGIWQCNRPGQPHGPSPHHPADSAGYGKLPWNEAMALPGSSQMGYGKKLFERFEWHKFRPQPEWVRYVNEEVAAKPDSQQWIWYPEGEPAADAPVGKRYFRKAFSVSGGAAASKAGLWISADDRCTVYINGSRVAENADWRVPRLVDVSRAVRSGQNVIAVEAENAVAPTDNPAGLLVSLAIQDGAGDTRIGTDASWLTSNQVQSDLAWTDGEFDDSEWAAARVLGLYGMSPWGHVANTTTSYGPFATGIPASARIIYVPEPRPIQVLRLEPEVNYRATAFDPQTGQSTNIGILTAPRAHAANEGETPTGAVVGLDWAAGQEIDDWVLVLERTDAAD